MIEQITKLITRLNIVRSATRDEIDLLMLTIEDGYSKGLTAKQNIGDIIDETIEKARNGEYVPTIKEMVANKKPTIEVQLNGLVDLAFLAGHDHDTTSSDVQDAVEELLKVIKEQVTEKDEPKDPRLSARIFRKLANSAPVSDDDLENWVTEAQCIEVELMELTKSNAYIQSALDSSRQDSLDLDDQLTALQAQYSTKNQKIETLINQVDLANTVYETKMEIIESLQASIRHLTGENDAKDVEIENDLTRITQLLSALEVRADEVATLQEIVASYEDDNQ